MRSGGGACQVFILKKFIDVSVVLAAARQALRVEERTDLDRGMAVSVQAVGMEIEQFAIL